MKKLTITAVVFMFALGVAFAQQVYTTKGGNIAAFTEDDLDLAMELIADGDMTALTSMESAGRVFVLKEGLQVFLVETVWLGKVKLRLKGTTHTFFTVMEAI